MNSEFALLIGIFFAAGTFLLLSRAKKEIIIGLIIFSNAVNLLLLATSGSPLGKSAPIAGEANPVDPLPQALVLTAIVIGYGMLSLLIFFTYKINRRENV